MGKKYKKWTQEEIERLRELARAHSCAEVAEIIGRSKKQTWNKAGYLGISFRWGRKQKTGRQLCWDCKWCTGLNNKCNWACTLNSLPPGCAAEPVKMREYETYRITDCPIFVEG